MKIGRTGFSRARRAVLVATATGALLTATPLATGASAANPPGWPTVTAKGAFLLDNGNGVGQFAKAADTRRPMASTTKIMTAYVVLSQPKLDLSRKITVQKAYPDYVTKVGASSAYLFVGDKLTTYGMLNAMMGPSGCDAAYALADTYGKGSTRAARTADFIAQMNAKAKALGLTNTRFDSFDGNSPNYSAGNYTTPRDLSRLARSAMQNTEFKKLVARSTMNATATAANGNTRKYSWPNSNQLIGAYNGAIGVKTGTNTPAGPCLVFAATRNGKTVTGVVLGSSSVTSRYDDAKKIMEYSLGPAPRNLRSGSGLRELPPGANRD
ncbi:D-alanyl-D-alanine carboxypeptidase family protein [Streptomyces venezuelae]|uniref:D-alanyl-D-alanine carboxypeptidase family protein n=1 Tax=Streptomyces venezuelae TaxID=54571 RepID=UPI001CC23C3B|nr:serine hydrolase [Streptomyces venezuelae]